VAQFWLELATAAEGERSGVGGAVDTRPLRGSAGGCRFEMVLRPGDIFAQKFLIERLLGRGGMGEVWQAKHLELDTSVAIKLLATERADEASLGRFRKEARAAARLRGKHTIKVRDFGEEQGRWYLVMDYVQGETVSDALQRQGAFAPAEAVRLLLDACEALAEAHAQGIVHRDIKPANLMIVTLPGGRSSLQVVDFGVARLPAPDLALTSTHAALGSPLYMPPEQINDSRSVDARADVWSLGVTLYEMLSQRRPFEAFSVAGVLARISTEEPTPLRQHCPDLDPGLDRAVMACLERDPARRTPSVLELAQSLAAWASDGQERVRLIADILHEPTAAPPPAPETEGASTDDQPRGWLNRATRSQNVAPVARTHHEPTQGIPWVPIVAVLLGALALWRFWPPGEATAPHLPTTASSQPPPALPGPSGPAQTASSAGAPALSAEPRPAPLQPATIAAASARPGPARATPAGAARATAAAAPPASVATTTPASTPAATPAATPAGGLPDPDSLGGRQ
jgi:eukaryotic-like serine/threonine-protein kinase